MIYPGLSTNAKTMGVENERTVLLFVLLLSLLNVALKVNF